MASTTDSARITSMAKQRKLKRKSEKSFASNTEIDFGLSQETKDFVRKVHHAYEIYLKVFACFCNKSKDKSIDKHFQIVLFSL